MESSLLPLFGGLLSPLKKTRLRFRRSFTITSEKHTKTHENKKKNAGNEKQPKIRSTKRKIAEEKTADNEEKQQKKKRMNEKRANGK